MRTIGLIGGTSWQSTLLYYRYLNEIYAERSGLGGAATLPHLLLNADFDLISRLQRADDWAALDQLYIGYAEQLIAGGAGAIVICANTMHLCAPAIEAATGLPVLHIADAVGEVIQRQGMQRVGLLGTRFTMERPFYADRLRERFNIETIIPADADRIIVHDIIYQELADGIFTEPSREAYRQVIQVLAKAGAEGVVLGCTEIPMLISPSDVDVPTFDTTYLHAELAVTWAMGYRAFAKTRRSDDCASSHG